MKIKTSELTGAALDWAVAKCNGVQVEKIMGLSLWSSANWHKYSTNWSQGGPIIEREFIHWGMTAVPHGVTPTIYLAYQYQNRILPMKGPTPLVAAMRCYVASKLGDEVEVPEELS